MNIEQQRSIKDLLYSAQVAVRNANEALRLLEKAIEAEASTALPKQAAA